MSIQTLSRAEFKFDEDDETADIQMASDNISPNLSFESDAPGLSMVDDESILDISLKVIFLILIGYLQINYCVHIFLRICKKSS